MGEVSLETTAYAKIILHAAKYPHCAVNGVLLADATKIQDGAKNQDLDIVDSVPLFHHSHYVSPMAEIALTQIEAVAQANKRIIAGYYAACENFRENSVEQCPGQKIAEKIVEYFPSAVFVVVDNRKMVQHLDTPAVTLHSHADGKWRPKDANKVLFQSGYVLETVSQLLQGGVARELVDFDEYLDDVARDWTNLAIERVVASVLASYDRDDDHDAR